MANVVEKLQRPTLVLAHNKTLAAQLYSEFKQFFPNNAVEYFVSYYDYYQPEAYIPTTGTYIEKDLSINEEIEKLRLSTTSSPPFDDGTSLLMPQCLACMELKSLEFQKNVIELERDQVISQNPTFAPPGTKFILADYRRVQSWEFLRYKAMWCPFFSWLCRYRL